MRSLKCWCIKRPQFKGEIPFRHAKKYPSLSAAAGAASPSSPANKANEWKGRSSHLKLRSPQGRGYSDASARGGLLEGPRWAALLFLEQADPTKDAIAGNQSVLATSPRAAS